MRYIKKRRLSGLDNIDSDDPMSAVANLFDIGLVFIVGLLMTIFSAYHLQELFSEKSNLTIIKKTESEDLEIITKKGRKIKAMKVTKTEAKGKGKRLGTAYKLQDGTTIYVPE